MKGTFKDDEDDNEDNGEGGGVGDHSVLPRFMVPGSFSCNLAIVELT